MGGRLAGRGGKSEEAYALEMTGKVTQISLHHFLEIIPSSGNCSTGLKIGGSREHHFMINCTTPSVFTKSQCQGTHLEFHLLHKVLH
jgi:hypothetical protein